MHDLMRELATSLGMIALLVVTHLIGLMSLLSGVRWYIDHLKSPWVQFDRLVVPLLMVGGLFAIHAVEIWAYALLYVGLGVAGLEQALYLSTGAYSTAGMAYFDTRPAWRLVAAHESVAGMLMLGWSTAFLFATLHRILTTEESHPLPEGAIATE